MDITIDDCLTYIYADIAAREKACQGLSGYAFTEAERQADIARKVSSFLMWCKATGQGPSD